MVKGSSEYFRCEKCNFETYRWLGRCPNCGAWNSLLSLNALEKNIKIAKEDLATPINRLKFTVDEQRYITGITEFDRVLGGGIVPGSLVLIGGEPGIGKSTLALQITQQLVSIAGKVLYVSAEESLRQISLRANRLSVSSEHIYLLSENNLERIVAQIAEIKPKITIIDSETTTAALGLQVIKAAELAQSNPELNTDDILAEIERIKRNQRLYFVVDNLEYLARGGRISQASKHLGNILQVKPILHITQGKIEVYEKVRTKPRALARILEEFEASLHSIEKVAIMHVDALEEAQALQEKVQQLYSGEVTISETGPVIGSHTGPGALGLAYY